jgi:transposase
MNKRRKFNSAFKTKVVLEALSERYSIQELSRKHGVHANQISKWKNQFLDNASSVFEKPASNQSEEELEKERLFKVIGQQKIEIDFLKKALS